MEKHTHDGKTYFIHPINKQAYDSNFFISRRGQRVMMKAIDTLSIAEQTLRNVNLREQSHIRVPVMMTAKEIGVLIRLKYLLIDLLD